MNRKLRRKAAAAARNMNAACQTPAPSPTAAPAAPPQIATEAPAGTPEELRQTNLAKFRPTDAVELALVEEMISAQWRQQTLARVEETAFAKIEAASPENLTEAFENQAKLLASLDRVRKGYAQQFSRALATLTKLRAANKRTRKDSPQEPQALAAQSAAPLTASDLDSFPAPTPEPPSTLTEPPLHKCSGQADFPASAYPKSEALRSKASEPSAPAVACWPATSLDRTSMHQPSGSVD